MAARLKRRQRRKAKPAESQSKPDEEDDEEVIEIQSQEQGEQDTPPPSPPIDMSQKPVSTQADEKEEDEKEDMEDEQSSTTSDSSIFDTDDESDTTSPRSRAKSIEFSELLRWVAFHTVFELGAPLSHKKLAPVRMASQGDFTSPAQPFLALSVSPAIDYFANKRLEDFATMPSTSHIGQVAPAPKLSMKAYQFSTPELSIAPAAWPENRPSWMPHVAPKSRAYVRDVDLSTLETINRENIAVLSYMDAYLAAVVSQVSNAAEADPFVIRTLSATANALAEVAQRSVASLHNIVLHRRDMALYGGHLKAENITKLRQAPFLATTSLFDNTLLKSISDQELEASKNAALVRVIRGASTSKPAFKHKKDTMTPKSSKRQGSAMAPQSKPKRLKLQSAPAATTPATPKAAKKQFR